MAGVIRLEAGALDTAIPGDEGDVLVVQHDAGGGLSSGVWEAGPMTWATDGYPVDETCVLIEGTVIFRYPDGSEEAFGPGDAFTIPKGTPLTWHQDGLVRKFWVIREG